MSVMQTVQVMNINIQESAEMFYNQKHGEFAEHGRQSPMLESSCQYFGTIDSSVI